VSEMEARRTRSGRGLRNADLTKKRLLAAAQTEFAAKGFDGARLGTIASAAGVQSALIHHYFADKEGLYREVVTRAVEQIAREGWKILDDLPAAPRTLADLRGHVAAFVDALVRFFEVNAPLLNLFQHEARAGGDFARDLVKKNSKPVFDAVVAQIEDMSRSGQVRADVDARQTCVSAVAMCAFPFYDEPFLTSIWEVDPHSPAFLEARKRDTVEMVMSRLTPAAPDAKLEPR
jgi:TetR/AcrR family transcriptional regulator